MQARCETPPNLFPCTPVTPRRRKVPRLPRKTTQGLRIRLPGHLTDPKSVQDTLKSQLGLSFEPDEWQVHQIHRILQGYDGICLAATGLGKSLLFEGTAKLLGKGKVVFVICPLKALERDQMLHAQSKGLNALAINEDTEKTQELWEQLFTTAQIIYLSPEMALSDSFRSHVWKDPCIRRRLGAVFIDEAHCIDEWGENDFRPQYRQLSIIRPLCGYDVPFIACTATCRTSTFDMVWQVLRFGSRPFWGVDVGADRPNLFFHTRVLKHADNPVLDALHLLPNSITESTQREEIDKSLFYFDSERGCRDAVDTLRKCLPAHLRDAVYPFSSDMSEMAKQHCWDGFSKGSIRIICATDAAGMGCSVPDVKNSVIFGLPESLSVVLQRWGRAGRDRMTESVCLLLVPAWAFRPETRPTIPALLRIRSKEPNGDSKANNIKRAKLDPALEAFINVSADKDNACSHRFIRQIFCPRTQLDVRESLTDETIKTRGRRSHVSPFELSWTILNVAKSPSSARCCSHCNPDLISMFHAADEHDDWLFTFAGDFHFPLAHPQPPASFIPSGEPFTPFPFDYEVGDEDKDKLRVELLKWRQDRHCELGRSSLLSSSLILPPKQLNGLLKSSARLLKYPHMAPHLILSTVKWDTASADDLQSLCPILDTWRQGVQRPGPRTPPSQRRLSKRTKKNVDDPGTLSPFLETRRVNDSGFPVRTLLSSCSPSSSPMIRLPAQKPPNGKPSTLHMTSTSSSPSRATASTHSSRARAKTHSTQMSSALALVLNTPPSVQKTSRPAHRSQLSNQNRPPYQVPPRNQISRPQLSTPMATSSSHNAIQLSSSIPNSSPSPMCTTPVPPSNPSPLYRDHLYHTLSTPTINSTSNGRRPYYRDHVHNNQSRTLHKVYR